VATFRLTAKLAEERIKTIAADSKNIDWSRHAIERMEERDIIDAEVLRILRRGSIKGEPERARLAEWKCKMVLRMTGGRDAGVVTIIMKNDRLFVVTVEWED
jgi:hypothetical protein